jgi:ketosteroid isomerase-like protein
MDVEHTLNQFIKAFEKLNLEEMMGCFTEDATSFFPVHHYPSKIVGKPQITARFEDVLRKINAAGVSRISLPIRDLDVVMYGDTALATFHIMDNDLSRRTIVLRRIDNEWLIAHLHASNAPLEVEV